MNNEAVIGVALIFSFTYCKVEDAHLRWEQKKEKMEKICIEKRGNNGRMD